MLQNTSKTLDLKKIMVYKTPPRGRGEGRGVNHIWLVAYALSLSITNLKIPHTDFKSNIHQYVMNKCQSVWEKQTENKLHELKPEFNSKCSFLSYSRQNQTKITRCRIEHTRLTHAYLLTNDQPPFCISCNEPFTVKHFLITCTKFNYIRKKTTIRQKPVKELFNDTPCDKTINFLKETTLFNKL